VAPESRMYIHTYDESGARKKTHHLKACEEFGTDFVPVRDGQIRRGHAAFVRRKRVRAYRLLILGNVVLKWQN
jgi:hypothetical protein